MRDINPSLQYLAILELIPRYPSGITVKELLAKLDCRYSVNGLIDDKKERAETRRIQRVLNALSEHYPIASSEARTPEWYWLETAPTMMYPALDLNTALIFSLARKYLEPIIPESSSRDLLNMFNRAEERFGSQRITDKTNGAYFWRDKVAIVPTGIPRILPRISSKIESIIYDAVLNEKTIKIKYQAWNKTQVKEYVVSPNGLYVRSQLIYLVVFNHANEKTLNFLMHRVKEVEIVPDKFYKIDSFNLERYVSGGGVRFALDETVPIIHLHIKLDDQPLTGLRESPISTDQVILQEGESSFSLTATVENTLELRQWLRSHAHHIEVIAPQELREEFAKSAQSMMLTYSR